MGHVPFHRSNSRCRTQQGDVTRARTIADVEEARVRDVTQLSATTTIDHRARWKGNFAKANFFERGPARTSDLYIWGLMLNQLSYSMIFAII